VSDLRARDLVSLPWHWHGPTEARDEHGNLWSELRIEELADFFVAGETREAVLAQAPDALEAFLAAFEGDASWPLLPRGVAVLPTDEPIQRPEISDSPSVAAKEDVLEIDLAA
jgi:hypothetical protein